MVFPSLRPQHLIPLAVALLALALMIGLRHRIQHAEDESAFEDSDGELAENGTGGRGAESSTHFTSFSDSDPIPTPHPTRINRIPAKQREEDFDAQKERAWGESYIQGLVIGEKGKRLAGAKVQLYENDPMTKNPPLRETDADEQGSFTLSQLNDGDMRYVLVARAEGYAPEARRVFLSGVAQESVMIHMEPGVPLAGVVRDAQTSDPISGATVYYPSRREQVFGVLGSVQSGPGGQFSFPAVPQGMLKALAEKEGYHSTTSPMRSPTDRAEIPMVPGGATIRGVTVDRISGKPQGGAKVIARTAELTASTMTKEDGLFEFRDMPPGDYSLVAIRGMSSKPVEFKLGDRETKEDIELVLPADLFVSGRVVHAYVGRPLPGVKVFYSSPAGKKSTLSDENGLFAFETMALEDYTLEVHHKGFLPLQEKRTTGSVETVTRKISKTASSDRVTLRLRPVPAIEGIVKSQRKGGTKPVFGAEVVVAYTQGKITERKLTRSDATGRFFVNLPERQRGVAKALVDYRGMIAVEQSRVPSRKEIELVLKPTRLAGLLALSDKTPLSGLRVASDYFFLDDDPVDRAQRIVGPDVYTNRMGRFYLRVPEDERVGITFYLPDGKSVSKVYSSRSLLKRLRTFVYEPVSGDVLSDANAKQNKPSAKPGNPVNKPRVGRPPRQATPSQPTQ